MALTGPRREEIARILEIVAKDGLPGPRDLDVALDAIEAAMALGEEEDEETGVDMLEIPASLARPMFYDEFAPHETADDFVEASPGVLAISQNWKRDNFVTSCRLAMVAIEVEPDVIAGWSDEQVQQAELWAISASYHASDNDDVIFPPRPEFLAAYEPTPAQSADRVAAALGG